MLKKFDRANTASNFENTRILNRVRMIAINGQLILILFAVLYLEIRLPLSWMFSLLAAEISFSVYSFWRVKQTRPISEIELLFHIVFDSLILAALVYFSGGANNPFIYLLLLPIALGTLMLTPGNLMLTAILQLFLYSMINIYQYPLELGESSPLASFHLHLAGMWVNFILTVILIAVFGSLTRRTMLKQEKKIHHLREKQLKDEQILSLGIMSASAAHELGTPLATMAIVVDDLKHEKLSPEQQQDMQLLATQISNCRQIIQSLNEKSNRSKQSFKGNSASFQQEFEQVLENWLVYRPHFKLIKDWSDEFGSLKVELATSVEQAVINLLDNAAEASLANGEDKVEIRGYALEQNLVIDILDFGTGITEAIKQSIGTSIQQTQKQDGLGWGLFLSNASIERAGGKVQLLESESAGTLTRISLPISKKLSQVK